MVKILTISSWLNFGRPASPGRGSAVWRNFLAPPYYSQRAEFASLRALFSFPFVFFFVFFCFISATMIWWNKAVYLIRHTSVARTPASRQILVSYRIVPDADTALASFVASRLNYAMLLVPVSRGRGFASFINHQPSSPVAALYGRWFAPAQDYFLPIALRPVDATGYRFLRRCQVSSLWRFVFPCRNSTPAAAWGILGVAHTTMLPRSTLKTDSR